MIRLMGVRSAVDLSWKALPYTLCRKFTASLPQWGCDFKWICMFNTCLQYTDVQGRSQNLKLGVLQDFPVIKITMVVQQERMSPKSTEV